MMPNTNRNHRNFIDRDGTYCDGLVSFHNNYLPKDLGHDILSKLSAIPFKELTTGGRTLERPGIFMVKRNEHGHVPFARCPSAENQIMEDVDDNVLSIVNYINSKEGTNFNHFKIQVYENNRVPIAHHSDKRADLASGSSIGIIRFTDHGEFRDTSLIRKKDGHKTHFKMANNSLLILSEQANIEYTHGVSKMNMPTGVSISIVLREVGTYVREDGHWYGIGCRYKTNEELEKALASRNIPKKTMTSDEMNRAFIRAFVIENKSWKDVRDNVYKDIILNSF